MKILEWLKRLAELIFGKAPEPNQTSAGSVEPDWSRPGQNNCCGGGPDCCK